MRAKTVSGHNRSPIIYERAADFAEHGAGNFEQRAGIGSDNFRSGGRK